MEQSTSHREQSVYRSLRLRVALGVALPIFLMLMALSWIHYQRERSLLEQHVRMTATQIGDATLGSLRHVMLDKDELHLGQILQDVGEMENIQRLFLVDLDGQLTASSLQNEVTQKFSTEILGCQECHQSLPDNRDRATILQTQPTTLRISTPIENEPACQECHDAPNHLGMLLIDVSMVDTRARLIRDLSIDLGVSLGFTLLITLGIFWLMQRLIVQRVERLQEPLAALASGNFSGRLPVPDRTRDELDQLTLNVNLMADDLERYLEEREQAHLSRYEAMLEERERIAREMHDGVAQLMGYVNAKSNAIRLNLAQDKQGQAFQQLEQLSQASQEAMLEMRASILGLRAIDQHQDGIVATMTSFLSKFSELTEIEVAIEFPEQEEFGLPPEFELHLLRITQEALFNIHKHSGARKAQVSLRKGNGTLELRIRDRGNGFRSSQDLSQGNFSQGIKNMHERAAAMKATLDITSSPDKGTEISLQIPLEK